MIDRAEEHLGAERAARYLRKFYPWYVERSTLPAEVAAELQRSADLDARELIAAQIPRECRSLATLAIIPRLLARCGVQQPSHPGVFLVSRSRSKLP